MRDGSAGILSHIQRFAWVVCGDAVVEAHKRASAPAMDIVGWFGCRNLPVESHSMRSCGDSASWLIGRW